MKKPMTASLRPTSEKRTIALTRRLDRLPDRDTRRPTIGQEHDRRRADRQLVADHELPRAVPERIGARADGPVVQVAPQVVGEGLDRRIALGGPLLERLEHDVVEVAAQRARSCCGGRAAAACSASPASGGVARARRLGVHDRAQPVERRVRSPTVGCAPVSTLEQHAERVDVGRARHVAALQLLGRGVVRREGAAAARVSSRRRRAVGPRRRAAWRCRSRAASPGRPRSPGCSTA